jgi:Saccharopine dehydrogenase NADP binding domain
VQPCRVLVIGGYGFFGRRLVERLSRRAGLHVTAAGRSAQRAREWVERLRPTALAALDSAEVDTRSHDLAGQLGALAPHVVIDAAGPFQGQGYAVARACIAAGAHCIDLADARAFVAGIGCLDGAAAAAGVAVISGASSVPALSSAAADHLALGLAQVDRIDIGISPGNRTERGLSTVQGVLAGCGQPLPSPPPARCFGWSGSRRYVYPAPVGSRLLSPCDVPDLELLPPRYAGRPAVTFGAGLELPLLHRAMNVMALLTRWGIVADWSVHATALKRLADGFKGMGSDAGAMHVTVSGRTAQGLSQTRGWVLLATAGDGPYVPTLAAAALVRKLQRGELPFIGARPCIGVLSLDNFVRETDGLRITMAALPT